MSLTLLDGIALAKPLELTPRLEPGAILER